jgi:hypothetical protein
MFVSGALRQASTLAHRLGRFQSNGKPITMKPFNPEEHGLSPSFILTNFTKMKG